MDKNKEVSLIQLTRKILGEDLIVEKYSFLFAALLNILSTLCLMGVPWLLQQMIDEVLPARDISRVIMYGGFIALALIIRSFLWGLHISRLAGAVERVFYRLRCRLMNSVLHKNHIFFNSHSEGDLMTRISSDVELMATTFFEKGLNATLQFLIAFVIAVTIMVWYWQLGLVSIISIFGYALLVNKLNSPLGKLSSAVRNALSKLNTSAIDLIDGEKEIRFFRQQKEMVGLFGKNADNYRKVNTKLLKFTWITLNITESTGLFIGIIPFLFGGWLICLNYDPSLTTGVLFAYYTYVVNMMVTLYDGVEGITRFTNARPVLERIDQVLSWEEEQTEGENAGHPLPKDESVEFRNVSFSYPGGKEIIKNFSLVVEPGEKVAIMGGSGSGKSTLLSLLLRFQKPTQGEILFGGVPVDRYPVQFYRSNLGYVRQETHLFRIGMAENIAFGWYDVPLNQVEEVAKLVQLDELIGKMPDGYKTVYGEKGVEMSGGQKQRVALARAIIRDPAVLILDEFTSALDKKTESEILTMVLRIFKSQTIICVTHSPEVSERFDRVIRLG
ncbi:MAG: ABC transporter ATP-binding protein [Ignavibacteria bacterium]|nr:ABC transporter ATP-binding protein [Ignavibacteria bacterium]